MIQAKISVAQSDSK